MDYVLPITDPENEYRLTEEKLEWDRRTELLEASLRRQWDELVLCSEVLDGEVDMKLTFRSPDGSLIVEAEPKTIKDSFEAIGQINEFLIAEPCGCCKSIRTYPQAKHAKDYVFFEWKCRDCGAAFSFGQNKEGGRLFPKRTDKDGNDLPDRGWSIYRPSNSNGQASGGFGTDGYRDPPSRQASEPAGKAHHSDEEIPF